MTNRLRVNEIYRSVQGESTWAGLPCTFIRLTGCHLRCGYCDSAHAFYRGSWMNISEILNHVEALGVRLVEITGGEPLLQPGCGPLASALLDDDYTVLCETSGALPIDRLPKGVARIMDLKCPSSGESAANDWSNVGRLTACDEVKFVVGDRADFDWAAEVVRKHELVRRCRAVLMSPVFGIIEPRTLVEWLLDSGLDIRFQLQMHKIIWEPDRLGV